VTHPYLALTEDDREEMLRTIGVSSVDELFRDIPAGVRFGRELGLRAEACDGRLHPLPHRTPCPPLRIDRAHERAVIIALEDSRQEPITDHVVRELDPLEDQGANFDLHPIDQA